MILFYFFQTHSLICCWIVAVGLIVQTETDVCEDTAPSAVCKKSCDQPGVADRCRRTCGRCQGCHGDRDCGDQCPGGRWDVNCTKSCSTGCTDRMCHQETGACTAGCKSCYTGETCSTVSDRCRCEPSGGCECKTGFTGERCDEVCSDYCAGKICFKNRTCAHGCVAGRYGPACYKQCHNCQNNTCSFEEGNCDYGCDIGYHGPQCNNNCSVNCINSTCKQTDGRCILGCDIGWYGSKCDKACSNCKKKSCDRDDGNCIYGCDNGYHGPQCNNHCSANCVNTICKQLDGRCILGCDTGLYGDTCDKLCPVNCTNSTCNQTDGRCILGCDTGWYGDACDKLCPVNCDSGSCNGSDGSCSSCKSGYTGSHCNITCPVNCAGERCNQTDGSCLECTVGWFGDTCDSKCSSGCLKHCDRQTGRCTDGCTSTACDAESSISLWVVIPTVLIVLLLLILISCLLLSRYDKRGRYKLIQRLFRSHSGSGHIHTNNLSNSYSLRGLRSLLKGSFRRNASIEEPLINIHLQSDVEMRSVAKIRPHVFSSYIPHTHVSEVEGSDVTDRAPAPCHVPPVPQLGFVWSTDVKVQEFAVYVKTMTENLVLINQFFDLPYGKLGPCDEGELPENSFKNRYRNIVPYDHSRVVLQTVNNTPNSDYINANFIHSYGQQKAFVATQGPYGVVMGDFWRMIWELKTGKIVMLTNLVESRKIKCEQYWPDLGQKLEYDGLIIQNVTEKELPDYTLRRFTVHVEGQSLRTIQHFHFTAWPDKGVPHDVTSLVDFHQSVKQSPSLHLGPIVLHCSAGIGRTGTFIALDYLIAQARAEGVVDVYECVARLRHQRMDLIQTEEQYSFLHHALLEALPSGDCLHLADSVASRNTKHNNQIEQDQREGHATLITRESTRTRDKHVELPDIHGYFH